MRLLCPATVLTLASVLAVRAAPSYQQMTCDTSAYPPPDSEGVPVYEVDLDLPPLQRWAALMRAKGPLLIGLVNDVKELIRSVIGEKVFNMIMTNLPKVATSLPYPYYEEMVGIATFSGMPLSHVTLYNIFYEAFTLCTSIVAQDPQGNLHHGRNLDTGVFLGWDTKNHTWRVAEKLRPLTVVLDWKKNGTTLFRSINFAGYVGVLTALKEEKFTFSLDKRFAPNGGYIGLLEWIMFNDHNQSWVAFLTREVMEEAASYDEARKKLSHTRILAPVYFILGGVNPGEGCVITRDRDNFNLLTLQDSANKWFLVQTNYDHWKSPPFFDDRRTTATTCMREGGQNNASLGLIYNVLSTQPVLNKETVYSAVMEAKGGVVHAWTRTCPDPCWPW